jgi:hypothetical protein
VNNKEKVGEKTKMRKKRRKNKDAYKVTKDLLEVTPGLIVGTSVAGMIPKLYP